MIHHPLMVQVMSRSCLGKGACHRRSPCRWRSSSRSRSRSRSCPIRGPRLALFYCSRPRLVGPTSKMSYRDSASARLPSPQSRKGQSHKSKRRGGCSSLASGPSSGPPLIRSQAPSRIACRRDPSNYQLARVCLDDTRKPSSTSWGLVKPHHALAPSARTIHVHHVVLTTRTISLSLSLSVYAPISLCYRGHLARP